MRAELYYAKILNQTECGHPTRKGGVCFGPHAPVSWNLEIASLGYPNHLDLKD